MPERSPEGHVQRGLLGGAGGDPGKAGLGAERHQRRLGAAGGTAAGDGGRRAGILGGATGGISGSAGTETCWFHNAGNVLDKMLQSVQRG